MIAVSMMAMCAVAYGHTCTQWTKEECAMKSEQSERRLLKSILCAVLGSVLLIGCSSADDQGGAGEGEGVVPDPSSGEAVPEGETQKDCISRPDHTSSVTVHGGNWGNWAGCFDMCPPGSFAYGVDMRSEAPRGSGVDDTSVNAISLWCHNRSTGSHTEWVESSMQGWGSWLGPPTYCSNTQTDPIVSGNLRLEAPQGSGDDTSANGLKISCKNSPGIEQTVLANTGWGSFRGRVSCPAGTAVCGIKTRVEAFQGSGDDTALNGLAFACCTF
jgi:hypothetical protein